MSTLPSGTVTFLFSDIEGSTRRWQDEPEAMRALLTEHDAIWRDVIDKHRGHLFKHTGDGVAAVFGSAGDAVTAAVDAKARLADVLPVRMGLHTGEAELREGDYFGSTLNRCARLMGIAHGGQVVCSAATVELARDRDDLRDLGEHRLRDLSRAERVWQIGAGEFPALRSLSATPSNLPTVSTELVGRGDDVEELSRLVRGDRVVTLTGTGGVGKTRLSLAVAAAVAPEFFDGVWFVELAPVADAAGIERAVASALGVGATTDIGRAGLVNYLRGRRLVLVLDNCEHVLDDAADFVTAVIGAAPEAHVVTTSREPLGVDGEVVRRVRSLGVPGDAEDSAAVDASDAVRMFVERASAASGDFVLNAGNRAAVVEICRKLDGIPLALELAAARVRGMTPAQIAARLDERFRLLSGARRAQERHRTLQAAVSWSYDLLSLDEKRVFRRLSVFPSSFDAAAADAVAGDGGDVFDVVLRLVDRSLAQHDPTTGRYRLLETLRQFGAERAVDADEADEVRDRYVDHYLQLARDIGPGFKDPRRFVSAVATLEAEMENLAAVAELLFDDGRWRELHQFCLDAHAFLASSAPRSFERWLDAAVDSDTSAGTQERIDALGWIAWSASASGAMELAARRAAESVALATDCGLPPSPAAFWVLGVLAGIEGRSDDYLGHATAAMQTAEQRDDRFNALFMRAGWLDAHLRVHGYDADEALVEDVLRETIEHPAAYASAVLGAAMTAVLVARDLERGLRYLETVVDRRTIGPVPETWLAILHALALTDVAPHAGVGFAARAARLSDRSGSEWGTYGAVLALAVLAARTGRLEAAQQLSAHAEASPHLHLTNWFGWPRADTLAALETAGCAIPVVAHELSRQELFAIVAELEAAS